MPSKFEYLTGPGLEYLEKYEPIGCRDYYTQERLKERGISNYFSGCVTLTLPKRESKLHEKEYVVLVGVAKRVEDAVRKQLKNSGIEVKIIEPTRPEPSTNLTWEERRSEVESMLDLYQNAKCVLTFRLHCALPCLALETPVLMVRDGFSSVRLTPYKDWLYTATPEQVVNEEFKDFLFDPPANPDTYKPVRESLQKEISEFIQKAEREPRKASELVRTSYNDQELMVWQHNTMKKTLHSYHIECHIDLDEINRLKKQNNEFTKLGTLEEVKAGMHDLELYKRIIPYSVFKTAVGTAVRVRNIIKGDS